MAFEIKKKKKSKKKSLFDDQSIVRKRADPEKPDAEDTGFLEESEMLDKGNEEDKNFDDDDGFDDDSDDLMDSSGDGEQVMEKHRDLLRQLTNFDPYLKEMVNGWLGLVWSEEDGCYVKQADVEPIMNVNCASWCVSFLRTYARDNNIITDIGKDDFIHISLDIIEVLWLNIGLRDEEFGIRSEGDIQRVCTELEHAAKLVLLGAGEGKYNKFLGSTYSSMDRGLAHPNSRYPDNQDEPIRRKGFIGNLFNKLNKGKSQTTIY